MCCRRLSCRGKSDLFGRAAGVRILLRARTSSMLWASEVRRCSVALSGGRRESVMHARFLAKLVAAATALALSACAPVVVGAGAAVVVDEIAEDQQGGDGLF